MARPALHTFFLHYLINGSILGEKLRNIQRVFWFSLQILSETFLILRIVRDIIKLYTRLHVTYLLFLSDFN
jgi:hypothetical protein